MLLLLCKIIYLENVFLSESLIFRKNFAYRVILIQTFTFQITFDLIVIKTQITIDLIEQL